WLAPIRCAAVRTLDLSQKREGEGEEASGLPLETPNPSAAAAGREEAPARGTTASGLHEVDAAKILGELPPTILAASAAVKPPRSIASTTCVKASYPSLKTPTPPR